MKSLAGLAAVLALLLGPVHFDLALANHAGLDDPSGCPMSMPPCQICATIHQPALGPALVFVGADLQVGPHIVIAAVVQSPAIFDPHTPSRAPPLI